MNEWYGYRERDNCEQDPELTNRSKENIVNNIDA
jgi:hypothetical protein